MEGGRVRPSYDQGHYGVVRSVLAKDVPISSSGRDVYTSFSCSCWMGGGRQERRMRALRVTGSSVLSGLVFAAPSLASWSAKSLSDSNNNNGYFLSAISPESS